MCGIAGHIGKTRPTHPQIAAAIERLQHRGPDSSGVWTHDLGNGLWCTLVFTRLAIQDLRPTANQPFRSGSVTLVFNGEVYNFVELRSSLGEGPERFRTAGDTEVLARLLDRDGATALDSVEGMFALAWFDEADRILTLARDAFGEKPLLFHRSEADFWFSSEVLGLSAISGRQFPPNLAQVRRFLAQGYRSLHKVPETFHEGVEYLRPAEVMRVSPSGRIEERRSFWQARDEPLSTAPDYETAVLSARDRLVESMRLRLRSDVPVALSLSGGIDSTALLSIAVRALDTPLETFTVRSGDSRYDDSSIARQTAEAFAVPNEVVDVRDVDFLPELERQVRARGAPTLTISSYAQCLLMSRVASAGNKVVVEGVGADEIFAGYYDHHLAFLADLAKMDPSLHAVALAEWREGPGRFTRNPFLRNPDYLVEDPGNRAHLYLDTDFFQMLLVDAVEEPFTELESSTSLLRNRMLNEIAQETLPVLLGEADSNAMASSVENRSPFLDRHVVDWVFGLPETYLIRRGYGKALLRDAVQPWAPPEVLWDVEKRGFNLSLDQVLDLPDPRVQAELLRDSPIWNVVKQREFRELVSRVGPLSNSRSKFLFAFLSLRAFLEQAY